MFMDMAQAAARRSTCKRLNVGAIIVSGTTPVSSGYNGSPPDMPHCIDIGCEIVNGRCVRTIHAEINALRRRVVRWAKSHLYVTHSPCIDCAIAIIKDGCISRVFYETMYGGKVSIQTMIDKGICVRQVLPSGVLIDPETGDVDEA
jgi:dCMP deaminase